eukprot:CAMPEP_0177653084 /NCGR_PEP_ID=MMETSP0447-20121125/13520_1 /TAXON_ID=0 /ORGANISM="Stygamoeba regulata, Strain BSH-02190019" /LENGTH=366 /DNA_ID=CAMNT_0019156463 /DNA_START=330 /DNA_END=1426 /DNA_ORIENTATION=-
MADPQAPCEKGGCEPVGKVDSASSTRRKAFFSGPRSYLEKHVNSLNKKGSDYDGFDEEFNKIEVDTHEETFFGDFKSAILLCNRGKNRYSNVLPLEGSRVKLQAQSGIEGADYINANYIHAGVPSLDRYYIATQGPLEETSSDFWRMVFEQKSKVIVMLTRLVENERTKCHRYWNKVEMEPQLYGELCVVLRSRKETEPEIAVRHFTIYHMQTKEEWNVVHFQYKEWPDHGLPSNTSHFRKLLHLVDQSNSPTTGPIIVHCSAGIGRTGTFCTVHSTLLRLRRLFDAGASLDERGIKDSVDIMGTVLRLRGERVGMVQTKEQYIFCYMAVLEDIGCLEAGGCNLLSTDDLALLDPGDPVDFSELLT